MIEIIPKVEITDKETLALVYTPGVAKSSLEIKENPDRVFDLTNRSNSIAVVSYDYNRSLERAKFLHENLGVDAYPFEIKNTGSSEDIKFVLKMFEPSFIGIDLSLIGPEADFELDIPVLTKDVANLKEFFPTFSKKCMLADVKSLRPVELREKCGGMVETHFSDKVIHKPIAIVSDGSAVLGLGNIGALAAIPVMEGKAVLFKSLGGVDAISLCVNSQEPEDIVKFVLLLENSFSGVNLEDICAPNCFEVEEKLIEKASIPIFHDDQHGTAIVVLAGLLNSLELVKKELSQVKIVISGAGAAGCAIAKLLYEAGAQDITLVDIEGIVYKGRPKNNPYLEKLTQKTQGGTLKDAIKGADVFIGVSAPDLLNAQDVKTMANKPIVFAIANPTPEIMPDEAKAGGAYITATGRSDFPNQINNSLVFPGLFAGVLDAGIKKIENDIKLKCAIMLASIVGKNELTPDYIIPDALDSRVAKKISSCMIV